MKLVYNLTAITLMGLSGCMAKTPATEAIDLAYQVPLGGTPARIHVGRDGRVAARGGCCGDQDARMTPQEYARFVALIAPMRAYAGGTMPCPDHVPSAAEIAGNPLAAAGKPLIATLRWETGDSVRLNIVCRDAPPALAKLKDALDILKRLDDGGHD